jgi:hypothetical protein
MKSFTYFSSHNQTTDALARGQVAGQLLEMERVELGYRLLLDTEEGPHAVTVSPRSLPRLPMLGAWVSVARAPSAAPRRSMRRVHHYAQGTLLVALVPNGGGISQLQVSLHGSTQAAQESVHG